MDYDFEEDRKYNKLYTALLSIVPGAGPVSYTHLTLPTNREV